MSASNRSMTVTDIALRSGFLELGRFSVEYRQMFGEKSVRDTAPDIP